ncbi:regulator [Allostreptomyces psammosilenae]|uniref:Sporulation protein n=1 Tax=Allostreptomyces psammosilenae TaxID=1892865 RepID=A0A852ZYU0_9ACTN|nr:regulator [Allostreptomyces psammosilenae]NYI06987.1 hypothetical protein [Allostreptomyces psammosilenae]
MAERRGNRQLAALIEEAGFSHTGLARRVDQVGAEHGLDLRYDKTSVTRWLRGQQPRGAAPAIIAEVFSRRLGRRVSPQDLGFGDSPHVYAGLEFAASAAEAVDIASTLWRRDVDNRSALGRVGFVPAGLVVPSRDWLIGPGEETVATLREERAGSAGGQGRGQPAGGSAAGGSVAGGTGAAPDTTARDGRGLIPRQLGPATAHPPGPGTAGRPATPRTPGTRPPGTRAPAHRQAGGLPAVPGTAGAPGAPAGGAPGAAGAPSGVAGSGGAGGAGIVAITGDGGLRLWAPDAPPGRIGAADVAAVRTVADALRALDAAHGGGHARQAAVRYLESEAEPLLRSRYDEATGRQLFAAVAELVRLAGWTSFDIGAHGLAQRYLVQALRLSQAGADRLLGAYILVGMSRQAVHLGHGREAVQLARVARQGVAGQAPPRVMALIHAVEARGHGLLGDPRACAAELVRAEHALQRAQPGDETPPWAAFMDEAQLTDEFAHCHRDLEQYAAAARWAQESLRLRRPEYARSRMFCSAVLATARLGLGEVDEACAIGREAVRAAAALRSVRAADYAREFLRRLAPHRAAPAVRALDRELGAAVPS